MAGKAGRGLVIWDVGQGASSALISQQGAVVLVDAPGRKDARITGGMLAAEALRALGIRHADAVVITHAQADHAGGVADLLRRLSSVDELWLADGSSLMRNAHVRRALVEAKRKGARLRRLARGERIVLPGMTIEVLWPPKGWHAARANDRSLVLRVQMDGCRFLLPGDIERRAERAIVPVLSPVDALLAPHHGSRTSSTPAFVAALRPKWVLFQVGRHNRWRFPHAQVVHRWQQAGARVWRTDQGAAHLGCRDGRIEFSSWHAPFLVRKRWALLAVRFLNASGPLDESALGKHHRASSSGA